MPNPIPMSPITKYAAKAAFRAPVLIEESYRLSGSPGSLEDVSVAYALTQQAKPTRIRKIPTRVAIALPPDCAYILTGHRGNGSVLSRCCSPEAAVAPAVGERNSQGRRSREPNRASLVL